MLGHFGACAGPCRPVISVHDLQALGWQKMQTVVWVICCTFSSLAACFFDQCDVVFPDVHSANKKIDFKQNTVSGPIAPTGDVMGASPWLLFFGLLEDGICSPFPRCQLIQF